MAATYTVKQVAEILGYSTNSIYTFLKEKRLEGVRFGKGRFRIPQSEIDRMLLTRTLPGKSTPPEPAPSPWPGQSPAPAVRPPYPLPIVRRRLWAFIFPDRRGWAASGTHNLFDWFVALAAIVVGISLVWLSRYSNQFQNEAFRFWLLPLEVTFVSAGIGLILTEIGNAGRSFWHGLFDWILIGCFLGYAILLSHLTMYDGAFLFGALAVILAFVTLVDIVSTTALLLYLTALIIQFPVIFFLRYGEFFSGLPYFFSFPSTSVGLVVWYLVASATVALLWWGYVRNKVIFTIASVFLSAGSLAFSLFFAKQSLWGQSFLMLLFSYVILFLPLWESITLDRPIKQSTLLKIFGAIVFFFIVGIGLINIQQNNIEKYSLHDLESKVSFARLFVDRVFMQTQDGLESLAKNPIVIDELGRERSKTLPNILRSFFEGNPTLHRIVITNQRGEIVSIYPYESEVVGRDVSPQIYYQRAILTKTTVVSGVPPGQLGTNEPGLTIATPIYEGGKRLGVLVGTLDADVIGLHLQQLAAPGLRQYFSLIGPKGVIIAYPNDNPQGLKVNPNGSIGDTYTGAAVLRASDALALTGWNVIGLQSLDGALRITNGWAVIVFLIIFLSVFTTLLLSVVKQFWYGAHLPGSL